MASHTNGPLCARLAQAVTKSSRLGPDLPPTFLAVNFPLELGEDASVGHSHVNGPTRQIPGTQNSKLPLPTLEEEPDWMRKSGLL